MPNVRQPAFRRRRDGRYIVKWGGRAHYLGRERDAAWKLYLEQLDAWNAWRTAKAAVSQSARNRGNLLIDIAEAFFDAKRTEGGSEVAAGEPGKAAGPQQRIVDDLRRAIAKLGDRAKANAVIAEARVSPQPGRDALRELEKAGEYRGFTRKRSGRYTSKVPKR